MKKLTHPFILLIILSCSNNNLAQEDSELLNYDPSKTYAVQLINEDLSVLQRVLVNSHTGLYAYSDSAAFSDTFDQLRQNQTSMTEREFLDHVGILSDVIRNGHTRFSTTKEYWNFIKTNVSVFPLKLVFIGGKVYVKENLSATESIKSGAELLAINGTAISEIMKDMMRYIPSDGFNVTQKYHTLGKNFFRYYYLFVDQSEAFDIKVRQGEKVNSYEVKGVSVSEIRAESEEESQPLVFELVNSSTAVLTIRSFHNSDINDAGLNYTSFIDSVFLEIEKKKIKKLVLDLRNNGGGSDGNGNFLYSYLTDKQFNYYKRVEVVNPVLDFANYISNDDKEEWDQVKGYFEQFAKPNELGTFNFLLEPLLGTEPPLVPNAHNFKGRLIVLINGGSFSATGELASYIHFTKRGTFVGEEAGGNYFFNVSGYTPTLILPNTKIRVTIPFMKYAMDVANYEKGRGVIPDYKITPTIMDVVNGVDTQKEYALKLLE